jgi:hypothetical protein
MIMSIKNIFFFFICLRISISTNIKPKSIASAARYNIISRLNYGLVATGLPLTLLGFRDKATAAGISLSTVASKLPGYGPPDILYPAFFEGSWKVTQNYSALIPSPKQQMSFTWPYLEKIQDIINVKGSLEYSSYYFRLDGTDSVRLDRGRTLQSKYSALYQQPWLGRFDFDEPNNLFLESSAGLVKSPSHLIGL